MQKPSNFDNAKSGNGPKYVQIKPGGHKCIILSATETTASTGKDMLVLTFDTSMEDEQPSIFSEKFREDTRENKKWPVGGTKYLVTENEDGSCNGRFKGFIESIENSNPGFKIVWGPSFCAQLRGKKIGVVFRKEEYLGSDNKIHDNHKAFYFCNYADAKEQEVPNVRHVTKEEKAKAKEAENNASASAQFISIPDGIDDELPFD